MRGSSREHAFARRFGSQGAQTLRRMVEHDYQLVSQRTDLVNEGLTASGR